MKPETPYGLGLGSNLGDRLANLQKARDLLLDLAKADGPALCSPIYETAPVDCPDGSGVFYNAVIEVISPLKPKEFFAAIQETETALGRPLNRPRNAPRMVDVDLLYAGNLMLNWPELEVPHPRLHLRRFVLEPLTAIRPSLRLPGWSETVAERLARLQSPEPALALVTKTW